MRIVGGTLKGMRLASPKSRSIRPTSDRVRESLFNVLQHGFDRSFDELRVLDAFAGTGALGFEALSRGAAFAVFIDTEIEARALIRQNVERSATGGVTKIFRRDATRLGPAGKLTPFDLCFFDPPYRMGLGEKALASARDGGWLRDDALCVLEEDAKTDVQIPALFSLEDQRSIGDTQILFLQFHAGGV